MEYDPNTSLLEPLLDDSLLLTGTARYEDDDVSDGLYTIQTNNQASAIETSSQDLETEHYVDLHDVGLSGAGLGISTLMSRNRGQRPEEGAQEEIWVYQRLNALNYLNLISYTVNLLVSVMVGRWGVFGLLPDADEVSSRNQSLWTPADFTNSIWIPIFIFEGIFSISQLHPQFRARPMVRHGVSIWFFYSIVASIALVFVYGFEFIWVAFLCAAYMLLFLNALLLSEHDVQFGAASENGNRGRDRSTSLEYWVLRFPFSFKTGWTFGLCIVICNEAMVSRDESEITQMTTAMMSFVVLVAICLFFLSVPRRPDYVIPSVLVWVLIGVYVELDNPTDKIDGLFGDTTVRAMRRTTLGCIILILSFLVPRAFISLIHRRFSIGVIDQLF